MAKEPVRVLIQLTIPKKTGFWETASFSMVTDHLKSIMDRKSPVFEVTLREKESEEDPVLLSIDSSSYDQLWLVALDNGDGLSEKEAESIRRFYEIEGKGLLTFRGPQDVGLSLTKLGDVGKVNFFHSKNQDPDASRRKNDNKDCSEILWPNYSSGKHGDVQEIIPVGPVHSLLKINGEPHKRLKWFPASPNEGGVGVPDDVKKARAFIAGRSVSTNKTFPLVVALDGDDAEGAKRKGRAVCHSSFHHIANPNWDAEKQMPTLVKEQKSDGLIREPEAIAHFKQYVSNVAFWLIPKEKRENYKT